MSNVKKLRPASDKGIPKKPQITLIPKKEVIAALKTSKQINLSIKYIRNKRELVEGIEEPARDNKYWEAYKQIIEDYSRLFKRPWKDTIRKILRWKADYDHNFYSFPNKTYRIYAECIKKENVRITEEFSLPQKMGSNTWCYKGFIYEIIGYYNEEESKLLILEEFDKERQYFEKLRLKFGNNKHREDSMSRPRIPENVRREVWNRDGGKCARCGSRINMEYDHIVPISKGGSNTARNIELLCEKCNRSKSNNVV